jgi:hypothetical protein
LKSRQRLILLLAVFAVLGWIGLAVGFVLDARHTFFAYLTAYTWALALAVGALGFLAIVNAMNATWPVAVRRLAEGIAATLPVFAVLFIPVFVGVASLYPWVHPEDFTDPHLRELVEHRRAYYNVPFWAVRWAVVFAVWIGFSWLFRRWSLRQQTGEAEMLHGRLCRAGVAALIPLGLTVTVASWDWLMSLTPTWYSTMYGFYFSAGTVVGGVALVILVAAAVSGRGDTPSLRPSHFHALGRVLLAFLSFWAYTAFFQYMLVWIANKPLEGSWFVERETGAWRQVSQALVIGHFAVPFLFLLSYRLKRSARALAALAVWMLAFRYLEAFWLVMPSHSPGRFVWGFIDAAALLALGGTGGLVGAWLLGREPLIAQGDPLLAKALEYEAR